MDKNRKGADDYQPLKDGQKTGWEIKFGGLTKREYFAGLAMQGIMSNSALVNMELNPKNNLKDSVLAEYSVRMADLILKELEKEGE